MNVIHVNNNRSWGVRKENVCYKTYEYICERNINTTCIMLSYSKPCVCGSLTHSRTTHIDCVLNKKYSDY